MNEIELWVFDMEFNRLAIIDEYEDVDLATYYQNHSEFVVRLEGNKEYADLFLQGHDRIIVKSNDVHRGFYVETPQYTDERNIEIELLCRSLSAMTAWRQITGQQRFVGNVEDAIKHFINLNAINPKNPNRIIPNLVLGVNESISIQVDETYTNTQLDIAIWEMCKKYDIGFEILMNHEAKKYVASTYQGVDRSAEQTVNPRVIFAKAFDNVNRQSYVDDKADYKSTAYVEAEDRTITVNDTVAGFARRELFVDAGSISRTYRDENDREITMSEAEYVATLKETGQSGLAEYPRVQTFESEIDADTQFVYGVDYFIGDKVTNRNDELGIATHSRVVTARENWNRNGYNLSLEFGTSIPKLLDKIKREVK